MTEFREMNVLSCICLLLPFQTIANVSECKLCTYLLVYYWVLSKAVRSYILRQTFVHLGFYTSLQSQSYLSALSQVCVLFNVLKASKYKYLAVVSENMTHTLEGKKQLFRYISHYRMNNSNRLPIILLGINQKIYLKYFFMI